VASRAWRELLTLPPGQEALTLSREQVEILRRTIERLEAGYARVIHEQQDLRGAQEQLREKLKEMEEARSAEEKRKDPPPSFVKPNVKHDEPPKKSGAKKGHEPHHRPPPPEEMETVEVALRERFCRCGRELGEPFDWDERDIEEVVKALYLTICVDYSESPRETPRNHARRNGYLARMPICSQTTGVGAFARHRSSPNSSTV
jgi:regulator of replication initiation timing